MAASAIHTPIKVRPCGWPSTRWRGPRLQWRQLLWRKRPRSNVPMLQWRKQKPDDEGRLSPRTWSWQGPHRKDVGRSKPDAERFAEFSRLSARIVELSLQEAHRDQTLRDEVPNKVTPGLWPFLGTSVDAPTPAPPVKNAGIAGAMTGKAGVNDTAHMNPQATHGTPRGGRIPDFAVLRSWTTVMIRGMTQYWSGSAAIRSLRHCWKSEQKDQGFSSFRTRILSRLRLAVEGTDHVRERTAFLIEHGSRRSARTFQFLRDRVPAGVNILTEWKPWLRLKHEHPKLRMLIARVAAGCAVIKDKFASTKEYRCRDCGGKVGVRGRPHNLMERYVLPLLLTQAVRCAECFRRDYRSIFTPLRERSRHNDETADHTHRNAA